jgi:hypothetical protein
MRGGLSQGDQEPETPNLPVPKSFLLLTDESEVSQTEKEEKGVWSMEEEYGKYCYSEGWHGVIRKWRQELYFICFEFNMTLTETRVWNSLLAR